MSHKVVQESSSSYIRYDNGDIGVPIDALLRPAGLSSVVTIPHDLVQSFKLEHGKKYSLIIRIPKVFS